MTDVFVDTTIAAGDFVVRASFEAGAGITALFGPSGSGKTVTMSAVAGLLRPTSGTIRINGETVVDVERRIHVPTQRRQLGMVFQYAALLPHRSPRDNVAMAARQDGRSQRREAAQEWLQRVRADHLATASTANLSGGEQQRVALARALVGGPRLLLLDEPFSALDQATRESLRKLVRQLVDEHGLSALIVTHDLVDITSLADRVVLYEPGRTVGVHDLTGAGGEAELARLLGVTASADGHRQA